MVPATALAVLNVTRGRSREEVVEIVCAQLPSSGSDGLRGGAGSRAAGLAGRVRA
jgi:hypothetical protein